MTRIKRLTTVVQTQAKPFDYDTPVYSGTPIDNTSSTIFVISCIDPRFTYAVEQYLLQNLGPTTNYDLFVLAGSAMGGNLTSNGTGIPACSLVAAGTSWQETLFDHLQVAISLHNVSQILILDHLGCAAYGVCGATDTQGGHQTQFNNLKASIVAATFYANGTANPTAKVAATTIFGAAGANITGFYFDTPIGVTTTLRDYSGVSQGVFTYPGTIGASVLVLGCIDPRFSELLSSFLLNFANIKFNFDLFITAGSSLGVNQSYNLDGTLRAQNSTGTAYPLNILATSGAGRVGPLARNWGPTFFDHLSVAISVHQITEVWVFDHLDCGAYKAIKFGSLGASDEDTTQHTPELVKLQQQIKALYPNLGYKGFIMDKKGEITMPINGGGIFLDTLAERFGSSRIRAPTSDIVDLRAKASADFVLNSQTQVSPQGFTNQSIQTKLTPTPSISKVLNPKVVTTKFGNYQKLRLG